MNYLQQTLAKIEHKIVETEELVPQLGELANKELEDLRHQKQELEALMNPEQEEETFNSVIFRSRALE